MKSIRVRVKISYNAQSTNTLSIQSHVLSIALSHEQFTTISNKHAHWLGIFVKTSTGKALWSEQKINKLCYWWVTSDNQTCFCYAKSISDWVRLHTWYALSKNGSNDFDLISCLIFSHWSTVGSTPVGLWAQACSSTIDPKGAELRSSTSPVKKTDPGSMTEPWHNLQIWNIQYMWKCPDLVAYSHY